MNTARVARTCDCGCPTIDLVVEGDLEYHSTEDETPRSFLDLDRIRPYV